MNETIATLNSASKTSTWMGILTVIVGIISLGSPFVSGVALSYLIGFLLIGGGITRGIYAFRAGSLGKGALMLIFGLVTLIAGILVVGNPVLGLTTLTILLTVYFFVEGLTGIILAFQLKPQKGWVVMLAHGIVTLLLAVMIFRNWPVSAVWLPGVLVGINLLFSGIAMLAIGSGARMLRDAASETQAA